VNDKSVKARASIEAAQALVNDSLVWDMTLPWTPGYSDLDETLPRFHRAGIDVISLTVSGQEIGFGKVIRWIAQVTREIEMRPDQMVLCRSVADIDKARAENKLALIYNLQETVHFEHKIELIRLFYDLGIRHALLVYNGKNMVGDGCAERTDCGLSRWGIEVIREMNRVGMLVCGTHSGYRTTMEAMEVTSAPFIFSHSNAYSVYPHYRNIRDDQIKACARTGGVIGVNGLGEFLDDHEASSASMFKHIDYIANLVGPEHVGIGLDYVKDVDQFWEWVRVNSYMWPPNEDQKRTFSKFAQPEQLVELTAMMIERGYAAEEIRKILGGNFRRVCAQVWK
jgi:membrane dipeptidase